MKATSQQVTDAASILDRFIRHRAMMTRTTGASWAMSLGGKTVLEGAAGVSDVESSAPALVTTGYRVASITKTFTATLVMQLVEQHKVRLDDTVDAYLPWARPALGKSGVTVRHLLLHSGGMIRDGSCSWGDGSFPSQAELHDDVLGTKMPAEPSSGFRYSNVGYALLGEIVEKVGGRDFATAIDRKIVRPLGLSATGTRLTPRLRSTLATGYYPDRPDEPRLAAPRTETFAIAPAGGLISNVGDLLRYQEAHFPGDVRLVTDLTKREMQRTQWQRKEEPHHGYGWMLWTVDGVSLRGHSGGFPGFVTRIAFAPDMGVAVAVLTSTMGDLPAIGVDAAFHTIAGVVERWEAASGRAPRSGGPTRAALGKLTGHYRGEFADIVIGLVNKALYVISPDVDRPMREASRLDPVAGDHRFVIADEEDYGYRGEHVSFAVDASGRATTLYYGPYQLLRIS